MKNKYKQILISIATALSSCLFLDGCNYTVVNPTSDQVESALDIVSKANWNTTVRQISLAHCAGCHATVQHPLHASPDLNIGWADVQSYNLVNFTTPTSSVFYTRLAVDQHNCWTDCASDAQTMLAALQSWAQLNEITPLPINPAYVTGPSETVPAGITATPTSLALTSQASTMQFTMQNSTYGPVTFTISVEQYDAGHYRIFWPSITAKSGVSLTLQNIQIDMNGYAVNNSTFSYIYRMVNGQGQSTPVVLDSTLSMIIPIGQGAGIDKIAPSFAIFTVQ